MVVNYRFLLRMAMYLYFAFLFCVVSACSYGFYRLVNMCAVHEFGRYPSPDGSRVAIVYESDCGATTPLNTNVSIVGPGVTVAPDDDRYFLSLHGSYEKLSPKWQGNSVLKIPLPNDEKIYRREKNTNGVAIRYQ